MAENYLGEIRLFSFINPPRSWAQCNGQLLPIAQNQALFSILGTTYGGDGRVTFALPDLRGRVPIHVSAAHPPGDRAGSEVHNLNLQEIPPHTHLLRASTADATERSPVNTVPAMSEEALYATINPGSATVLSPPVGTAGGNQAHLNMQPYLTLCFCICLAGIYPSRN